MSELVKRLRAMSHQANVIATWCDDTAQKISGLEYVLDQIQAQLDDFAGLVQDMTTGEMGAIGKDAKTSPAHPAARPVIPPEKIEEGIAQTIAAKEKSHGP